MEHIRGTTDAAACALCPFAKDGKPNQPVLGIGPTNPAWVMVGEGPGHLETKTGTPFVGASGQLVNRALEETRSSRADVWITNATLCANTTSDEKIKHLAATACRQRLFKELARFPERPLLALGGVAARTMLREQTDLPISEIAGAHFMVDDRSVIPTIHPAAILRASGESEGKEKTGSHVPDLAFWALKFDILKIRIIAEGQDIFLSMRYGIEIETAVRDRGGARQLVLRQLDAAKATGRIAIDYETYVDDPERNNALQAFVAKIRLIGLAVGGKSVCVAWDLLNQDVINAYRKVLADPAITKAYHNGLVYDRAVEQNQWYGFAQAGPVEDTLFLQHAAFPGAKKRLQSVTSQFYAVEPWKSDFRDKGDTLEDEANYCAKDALATEANLEPLHQRIKTTKTQPVYDVDRIKAAFAAQMHLKGYYVCPDVNTEIKRRLTTVIDESKADLMQQYEEISERVLYKLACEQAKVQRKADSTSYVDRVQARHAEILKNIAKGKFTFDPSNDGHAVAFFKARGIQLWQTTETGRTASGASVLEKFSQYPEVETLLRMRANETLLETFVIRMFEWVWNPATKTWKPPHVQDDGRVHPLWSPTQISGRFGSRDPASSNWTEGDEANKDPRKRLPNIRRQIVAPLGRGFVSFDYAQLESRVMAVQSGDAFLCKVFTDGLDLHREFARLVFPQIDGLDKSDPEYARLRGLGKTLQFGVLYGGSEATVHKFISTNEPSLAGPKGRLMVRAAISKMRLAVPGLIAWQQRTLRETSQPPYTLRSFILGRSRVFPLGNPPPTDVANNPVQFTASDVVDTGLCRLLPLLDKYSGAFGILHQHDSILFEVMEGDMLNVARDVKRAFTTSIRATNGVDVEFPIELKIGFSYHSEASDDMKQKYPYLHWGCGRPGLKKVVV